MNELTLSNGFVMYPEIVGYIAGVTPVVEQDSAHEDKPKWTFRILLRRGPLIDFESFFYKEKDGAETDRATLLAWIYTRECVSQNCTGHSEDDSKRAVK